MREHARKSKSIFRLFLNATGTDRIRSLAELEDDSPVTSRVERSEKSGRSVSIRSPLDTEVGDVIQCTRPTERKDRGGSSPREKRNSIECPERVRAFVRGCYPFQGTRPFWRQDNEYDLQAHDLDVREDASPVSSREA